MPRLPTRTREALQNKPLLPASASNPTAESASHNAASKLTKRRNRPRLGIALSAQPRRFETAEQVGVLGLGRSIDEPRRLTANSSTEYGLEIFVLTCDQQDCWTSYDLLTYDADDEDISVSPRNMETGNQFFVGISPTLGCRYPWPVEGKKAGVIEIVEDVGDEMENVNEFAMDGNEKIDYFFADEDWIVVLDERKLNIWGFDEVKCKVLKQSLSL